MALLDMELLSQAWKKLRNEREEELLKLAPDMVSLQHVYIKLINDDGRSMTVQFSGLENSVNNTSSIPQVKNVLKDWLGKVSTSVQIAPSTPTTLVLTISKTSNLVESKPLHPRKIKSPVIREHKYEHDLSLDRVKIIMKV